MSFQLTVSGFGHGATIPQRHTCEGRDVSPAMSWSGAPEGTKSFALIVDDPDAPVGTWVHWVLFNLPERQRDLQEGIPPQETLANGARQGLNDFKRV